MSKSLTNQSNVIQLYVRRAKLDEIADQNIAQGVQLCLSMNKSLTNQSNVIQFADKKRAIITARAEVQFCLTIVGWDMWADRPTARPKVLETILKYLDEPERVRQALRELGEPV